MNQSKSLSNHIRELEEHLLRPSVRTAPDGFLELLATDFFEFGVSGNVWRKKDCRGGASTFRWKIREFRTVKLAPNVVLATYRISRRFSGKKKAEYSLRSSIWKLNKGKWAILFHQGTPTTK
jgi:hypothetical protein